MKKQLLFTTISILFSAISFGQIPTDGLLLHYKFDGNLNDASGNNRNASANGTANYVSDFEGNANSAIDFENALNYITANNTASLPLHGKTDWSMSFFYHCEDGEGGGLLEKKTSSSQTLQFAFALREYGTSDSLNFTAGTDSYIQGGWAGSLGAYSTATKKSLWNHLALVKKGDTIYTYSNGSLVNNKKFPWLDRNSGNSQNMNIGQAWIVGDKFDGLLDDFAIHNRALTEQEIKLLGERITAKTCYQSVNDTTHVTIYDTVKIGSNNNIPTDGLIAHYPFNGNANDESTNSYNGSVNGATLAEDRFGNTNSAYKFLKVNRNEITTPAIPLNSRSFSISTWAKKEGNHTEDLAMFGQGTTQDYKGLHFIIRANENVYYSFYKGGASKQVIGLDEKWHHYTTIYDYENKVASLYMDGNLLYSNTSNDNPYIGTGSFFIGGLPWKNRNFHYNGSIDDIRIYNRVLSLEEINTLKNEGLNICNKTVYDTISVQDTLIIKTTINGVNNTRVNHTTKVYPNPAKDFVNFDFTNYTDLNGYSVKIINNVSQEVYSTEITQQNESIELSSLGAKGLYFIQILNAKNELVEVKKLLIE